MPGRNQRIDLVGDITNNALETKINVKWLKKCGVSNTVDDTGKNYLFYQEV